jgi:hypothetical protein
MSDPQLESNVEAFAFSWSSFKHFRTREALKVSKSIHSGKGRTSRPKTQTWNLDPGEELFC